MKSKTMVCALFLTALATPALAADSEAFKLSGFLTVVGGKVLSSTKDTPLPYAPEVECPCFTSNWSYYGIYHDRLSFKPDSRVGVQVNGKITGDLSYVIQVVSRTADTKPNVQWAYLSYQATDKLQLQIGRKRVPLYYYSEFQDVGFAIPWVSPPTELYGWEINNFNGVAARYSTSFDDYNIVGTLFRGDDTVKKSLYNKMFAVYWNFEDTDVSWKQITGGDLEINKDWWTLRAIHLQSHNNTYLRESKIRYLQDMKVYGLAFNGDFGDWFFLTELTRNDRSYPDPAYTVKAPAFLFGVGWRIGKWTPFISRSQYMERTPFEAYSRQGWDGYAAVLRYDVNSSSSVKAQLNYNRDRAPLDDFSENATVFRVSYDLVF